MEQIKAPEKIYLTQLMLFATPTIRSSDNEVEYVRKDAIIERAVDYIANNMQCNGYTLQTKVEFIRDFKKYMKEKLRKDTEYPFKKGDKVIIHCKSKRHQDNVIFELFNNKVGTIQYIGKLKTNPWGNIGVIIDGGYNDAFFVEELELVSNEAIPDIK